MTSISIFCNHWWKVWHCAWNLAALGIIVREHKHSHHQHWSMMLMTCFWGSRAGEWGKKSARLSQDMFSFQSGGTGVIRWDISDVTSILGGNADKGIAHDWSLVRITFTCFSDVKLNRLSRLTYIACSHQKKVADLIWILFVNFCKQLNALHWHRVHILTILFVSILSILYFL